MDMLNDFKFQSISTFNMSQYLRGITTYQIIYIFHWPLLIEWKPKDYETAMLKHFLIHIYVRIIYTNRKFNWQIILNHWILKI